MSKKKAAKSSRKLLPNLNHITEDLKPLAIEVKKLTSDPANAMDHDERSIDEIKSSLVAFGQRKPIVCQVSKNGILIRAGNGTYEAAKQLGWEHIAAVKIKEDNTTATGYAIADNRTAQFGKWNPENLDKLFKSFDGTQFSSASLGWNPDELKFIVGNWNSDISGMDKIKSNLDGIVSVIKIICPQEIKEEVFNYIKDVLSESSFEGVSIE